MAAAPKIGDATGNLHSIDISSAGRGGIKQQLVLHIQTQPHVIIEQVLVSHPQYPHQRGTLAQLVAEQVAGCPQAQGKVGRVGAAKGVKIADDRTTVLIGVATV